MIRIVCLMSLFSAALGFFPSHGRTARRGSSLSDAQNGPFDGVHLLSELRAGGFARLSAEISPDAQLVLIGEGTHGTEEFFRVRAEITQCFVAHHHFDAVVCEGDVRPFFQLNEFASNGSAEDRASLRRAEKEDGTIPEISRSMLAELFRDRFPDWMWSNAAMASFVAWLKEYNACARKTKSPVQLLGMDIQSPVSSMEYVLDQLVAMGEDAAARSIHQCYATLLSYQSDLRRYGNDVYSNKMSSQAEKVARARDILVSLHQNNTESRPRHETLDATWFELMENGHSVVASEAYFRQRIYPGHATTWNVRTRAMLDSISRIRARLGTRHAAVDDEAVVRVPRLVVWAHNSHVGDMSATGYAKLGQASLGQLCRETFGRDRVFLIGMTTFEGEVRAARADRHGACWEGRGEVATLQRAAEGSHESVLHSVAARTRLRCGEDAYGLRLRRTRNEDIEGGSGEDAREPSFDCLRPERFVGSCYLPQTEQMSHYTKCNMANQLDFVFHMDKTSAIKV